MMRNVERSEIVDYQTYEETREAFRRRVMAEKARRRVHVGECFTFLFENALTMRYQVQEMMRAEKIIREKDIRHELDTYNALLGGAGELASTLLIELDDPAERAEKLRAWLRLPGHIYARMEDGARIRPVFDSEQMDSERLSSVQYLKFPTGGRVPVAVGIDFPGLEAEAVLTADQKAALASDLSEESAKS